MQPNIIFSKRAQQTEASQTSKIPSSKDFLRNYKLYSSNLKGTVSRDGLGFFDMMLCSRPGFESGLFFSGAPLIK